MTVFVVVVPAMVVVLVVVAPVVIVTAMASVVVMAIVMMTATVVMVTAVMVMTTVSVIGAPDDERSVVSRQVSAVVVAFCQSFTVEGEGQFVSPASGDEGVPPVARVLGKPSRDGTPFITVDAEGELPSAVEGERVLVVLRDERPLGSGIDAVERDREREPVLEVKRTARLRLRGNRARRRT